MQKQRLTLSSSGIALLISTENFQPVLVWIESNGHNVNHLWNDLDDIIAKYGEVSVSNAPQFVQEVTELAAMVKSAIQSNPHELN